MGRTMRDMDYLQADNQMKTFANITGGESFFPRFPGEMPDIFATSTRTSAQNINWFIAPPTPSRTAPIASCA